ncbi:putative transcription regulator IWS1 family [Rosa chinensis]|uniref:Putative transcription regulator IWS1 family n=1 Tax=Rosa chinensis TaxID=74649 RepID=A0A2P6SGM8_ROSCH|nr:probable mediator of RNA polymerase II transcription subunit 26b [Rosa chinensis]PRQ57837.1 putative transcription regulator IWS1 family [Rosa chinensis]
MARTKSRPLNYWRNYFETAKDTNIFSIIDHAIKVAASDFPKDFSLQKDRIVARLSCIQCLGNDEESAHGGCKSGSDSDGCEGLLEADVNKESNLSDEADRVSIDDASQNIDVEVLRIKEIFENSDKEKANDPSMLESLTRLKMMTMTVETLEATAIGKVVSGLKKHGSKQIRDLARTLVDGWKVVVSEYLATQNSKQSSSDVLSKQNKNEQLVIKKQEVVAVKPIKASNNNEEKMQRLDDEVAAQAKIEATKRKLHERYEQIENTKKQRMVQVLDDLPKQGPKVGSHTTNLHGKKPGSAHGRISDKLHRLKKQAGVVGK